MRFLSWLIGVPFAVAAILFAVSNLQPVRLELWPLPFSVELPVYVAVLAPLAVGMVVGGVLAWLAAGRHRSLARQQRRRADELERQLDALRQPATPPAAAAVAISHKAPSQS